MPSKMGSGYFSKVRKARCSISTTEHFLMLLAATAPELASPADRAFQASGFQKFLESSKRTTLASAADHSRLNKITTSVNTFAIKGTNTEQSRAAHGVAGGSTSLRLATRLASAESIQSR